MREEFYNYFPNTDQIMAIQGEFSKAFFQATFANFSNQIFERQLYATKVEMDLLRKLQGKTQAIGSHWEVIKNCRKSIESVDSLLRDVKPYFTSLRIGDLYELFQTMFRILVYDVKKISQCYLRRFQYSQISLIDEMKYKKRSLKKIDTFQQEKDKKMCICQMKAVQKMKQLQHLDFQINGIESQQAVIQQQMINLIKDIDLQKIKVEKIDCNSHHIAYQQLQKIFVEISRKAESIFSNFLKGISQNKNKMVFLEPEAFDEQIFSQLKRQITKISKNKMSKLKQILNNVLRTKSNNSSFSKSDDEMEHLQSFNNSFLQIKSQQQRLQSQLLESIQMKKQCFNLPSQIALKDKEIENLKRFNKMLNTEIVQIREIMKNEQQQRVRLLNQNKQIESVFKKRSCQFETLKNQLKWTMQKTTKQINTLTTANLQLQQRIHRILKSSKGFKSFDGQEKQTQTYENESFQQNLLTNHYLIQHKSFLNMRSRNRKGAFIQFKEKKVKNVIAQNMLRESVEKICQFLLERSYNSDEKTKQKEKEQVYNLLKGSKYEELIFMIKTRLDSLYQETYGSQENGQDQKQKKNRSLKKINSYLSSPKNSRIEQLANLSNMKSFGIQTEETGSVFQKEQKSNTNLSIKIKNETKQKQLRSSKIQSNSNKKTEQQKNINKNISTANVETSKQKTQTSLTDPFVKKQSNIQKTVPNTEKTESSSLKKEPQLRQKLYTSRSKMSTLPSSSIRDKNTKIGMQGAALLNSERISPWNTPNLFRKSENQDAAIDTVFNLNNPNRFSQADYQNTPEQKKKVKKVRKISNFTTSALFQQINLGTKTVNENQYKKQLMLQKMQNQSLKRSRNVQLFKQQHKQNHENENQKVREILIDIQKRKKDSTIPEEGQKVQTKLEKNKRSNK